MTANKFDEQMSRLKSGWSGAASFYADTKKKLLWMILQDLGAGDAWFRFAVDKALEGERMVPAPLWFRDFWSKTGGGEKESKKWLVGYTDKNDAVYSDNPHILEDTNYYMKPIKQKAVAP